MFKPDTRHQTPKEPKVLSTLLLFISIVFINSCNTVEVDVKIDSIYTIEEGRVVFDNRSNLETEVERLKVTDRAVLEKELEQLYIDGFRSIRPIISYENESITQLYEGVIPSYKIVSKQKTDAEEDFDDFEEIIGDDEFASLLNTGGEIQVADDVYKYTDAGLFIVNKEDTEHLYTYLEESAISLKSTYSAFTNTTECSGPAEYELRPIDEYIDVFSRVDECNIVTNGGIGIVSNSGDNYGNAEQFINGLEDCIPKRSFWSDFFGDSQHCVDKFQNDDYRVKTKFWNQNYLLVKSIGVSAKHQRKRFWVWWTIETDEIRLGINSISFEVSDLSPVVNNYGSELFFYEGNIYDGFGSYIGANYDKQSLNLPFDAAITFVVDLTNSATFNSLNVDPNAPIIDKIDKFANDIVLNEAKDILKNSTDPDKSLIIVAYLPNKKIVHLTNHYETKHNARNVRYLLDWQGRLAFSLKFKATNSTFSLEVPTLTGYSNAKVDMYGVARRSSEWAGNRFIYGE